MPQRFSTARGREFGEGVRAAVEASGMPARRHQVMNGRRLTPLPHRGQHAIASISGP